MEVCNEGSGLLICVSGCFRLVFERATNVYTVDKEGVEGFKL